MASYFLNADLDIVSRVPLDPLLTEIGDRAYLFGGAACSIDGAFVARYEIDNEPLEKTPEILALAFCNLIESLSAPSFELWAGAESRILDFGYDVTPEFYSLKDGISPATLMRLAKLGIEFRWTFYRVSTVDYLADHGPD